MRVKTRAGDVEMTAAMVRPGMVFQGPTGAPYKLVRFDPYAVAWGDSDGVYTEAEVAVAHTFLGCDPAIATREDVDRYGVAPGIDAGAHGFARLQDGGASDLQDPGSFRRGMVFEIVAARYGSLCGQRFVLAERIMGDGNGGESWECWGDGGGDWRMWKAVRDGHVRLVGLDMRHARQEDVLRLCCLDANRSASGPGGERCTLAIGDHGTHEDIAAGVTWSEAKGRTDTWDRATIGGVPFPSLPAHPTVAHALDGVDSGKTYEPPPVALIIGDGLDSITIACKSGEVFPHRRHRPAIVNFTVADLAPWRHRLDQWLLDGGGCEVLIGDEMFRAVLSAWERKPDPYARSEDFIVMLQTEHSVSDDALRARLREEERARQIARARVGEPEPGTIAWITALVKEDGYGCYVERARRGPGTVDVTVLGGPMAYCAGLQRRLRDSTPAYVDVLVEPADVPPDDGAQLDALAAACDMRRGFGETDESLRARFEAYVREEMARVDRHGFATSAHYGPAQSAAEAFTLIESGTHRALDPDEPERLFGKHSLKGLAGMAGAWPGMSTAIPAPGAPPDAEAERKAARALAKALRSALPGVDALPWSAAERKALRSAAHAVCEACEAACEGSVPYGVTWGATEMVAALATAAEIGPDAIGQAEKIAARVVGYMKGAS